MPADGGDVCLFAHFDAGGIVAAHVRHYLREIQRCGFEVIVISTAGLDAESREHLARQGITLLSRPNRGLDFASWAHGLAHVQRTAAMRLETAYLLLANDSVYGPLGDLPAAVARLRAKRADVYGLVESPEVVPHLQSWFLLLAPPAHRHPAFHAIFAQDFEAMSKRDIVRAGEIRLSQDLRRSGLILNAMSNRNLAAARQLATNPTHALWRELIERDDVPFLKVELLRSNPRRTDAPAAWKEVVRSRVPELIAMIEAHVARTGVLASRQRSHDRLVQAMIRHDDHLARSGRSMTRYAYGLVNVGLRATARLTRRWRRRDVTDCSLKNGRSERI